MLVLRRVIMSSAMWRTIIPPMAIASGAFTSGFSFFYRDMVYLRKMCQKRKAQKLIEWVETDCFETVSSSRRDVERTRAPMSATAASEWRLVMNCGRMMPGSGTLTAK